MARTLDITGKIIDGKTNEAIPFANIVPLDSSGQLMTSNGTSSDIDGNFKLKIPATMITGVIPILAPRANKFRVSFVGYDNKVVDVIAGKTSNYVIKMGGGNTQLDAVNISVDSPATICKKQGGAYDAVNKKCLTQVEVKKRNRTWLYIGIGLGLATIAGVIIYKKRNK